MAEETPNTGATENAEAAATDAPALSIADVKNAVNIIDFACNQGAFKGWETIVQVMNVRNNLNNFVTAVAPPEENTEGEEGAAPTEAPEAPAEKAAS